MSAQKCRLKKKDEFEQMRRDMAVLKAQNGDMKEELMKMHSVLILKMEENSNYQKKLEQLNSQHSFILTQLLTQNLLG